MFQNYTMIENNPWASIRKWEEFQYFCCPECPEKHQSKKLFIDHALKIHPNAKVCLETIEIPVKNEENEDESTKVGVKSNTKVKKFSTIKRKKQKSIIEDYDYDSYIQSDYPLGLDDPTSDVEKPNIYEPEIKIEDQWEEFEELPIKKIKSSTKTKSSNNYQGACDECGKVVINVREHKKNVHSKTKYPCDLCGKIFPTKTSLKRHTEIVHEGIKKFECEVCGKKWPTSGSLSRHINGVHEKIRKTVQCHICQKTFTATNSYLKIHIAAVHQKIRKWKCEHCPLDFAHKQGYLSHIDSIHKGLKVNCDYCENSYTQRTALRRHLCLIHEDEINEQNKEKGGIFPCNECEKILFTEELLKEHLVWKCRHENNNDKDQKAEPDEKHPSHQCDLCGKAFLKPVALKKHKILRHEDEMNEQFKGQETFSCKTCSKVLSSQEILKDHQRFVHFKKSKPKPGPGTCSICGKLFKNKTVIKDHIKVIHEKILDHQCEICGKACSNKSLLSYHMAAKHDVNTKNNCSFCGKTFGRKSALDRHIGSVHEGLKYVCDFCKKSFTQSCYLKNHIRKNHA